MFNRACHMLLRVCVITTRHQAAIPMGTSTSTSSRLQMLKMMSTRPALLTTHYSPYSNRFGEHHVQSSALKCLRPGTPSLFQHHMSGGHRL
jgi:hypothetical protein